MKVVPSRSWISTSRTAYPRAVCPAPPAARREEEARRRASARAVRQWRWPPDNWCSLHPYLLRDAEARQAALRSRPRHAGAPHAVGDVVGTDMCGNRAYLPDVDRRRRRHVGHVDAVDFDAAAVARSTGCMRRVWSCRNPMKRRQNSRPVDVERQIVDRQHVAEPARYILDLNNG